MTERADVFFSGPRSCWYIELFESCGSFRDLAHESCIEGANHARGEVLKSTLVVDNDSVHTYTGCFQSHTPAFITDAHAPQRLRKRLTACCDTQSLYFIIFLVFSVSSFFSTFLFYFLLFDKISCIFPFNVSCFLWFFHFFFQNGVFFFCNLVFVSVTSFFQKEIKHFCESAKEPNPDLLLSSGLLLLLGVGSEGRPNPRYEGRRRKANPKTRRANRKANPNTERKGKKREKNSRLTLGSAK